MRKLLAFIILICATLACGRQAAMVPTPAPAGTLAGGDSTRDLSVDGIERSYILHTPQKLDPNRPVPVLLVFHGGGGNAENAIHMTGFNDLADEFGFLAVYPNGSGRLDDKLLTWNGGDCCGYAQQNKVDDIAFVRTILDDLRRIAPVDNGRIYATGMSNGGIMSYRLACELSDQIAAIGSVSGTQNFPACAPKQAVAVIHFHGTDDKHIPYNGGIGSESLTNVNFVSVADSINFWVAYNQCNPTPSAETFDDISHTVYSACANGTAVELYTINGGGHAWPGGQSGWEGGDAPTHTISASRLLWAFFAAHPRP